MPAKTFPGRIRSNLFAMTEAQIDAASKAIRDKANATPDPVAAQALRDAADILFQHQMSAGQARSAKRIARHQRDLKNLRTAR